MLGLELHTWEEIMVWSLGIAALSAVAVVVSTRVVVLLQREENRIAGVRVAEATERATDAELKLEELRARMAPRRLNESAFLSELKGKPAAPTEVMYVGDDPESFQLAWQFVRLLAEAKWPMTNFLPVPPENPKGEFRGFPMPSAQAFGAQVAGITVVAKVHPETKGAPANPAFRAMSEAIFKGLGRVNEGRDSSMQSGTLRVVIAPKEPQQ